MALARRAPAPPRSAETLVETGEAETVAALLTNPAAEWSERLLLECLDRLSGDGRVVTAMVGRDRLPPAAAQRLAAVACGRLGAELAVRHPLSPVPEGKPGELGSARIVPHGGPSTSWD